MKPTKHNLLSGMFAVAVLAVASSARAQIQTTGALGSPSATTTLDGTSIPPPPAPFAGKGIYRAAPDGSTTWSGTLAVFFPGEPRLSLSGPPFKPTLHSGY